MKKITFIAVSLLFLSSAVQAQVQIGFKLSPNINIAHIKDNDDSPSSVRYAADGSTTVEGNVKGVGAGVNFDFPIQKNWYFGTGVWFTTKNFYIRNTDGAYSGVSKYNTLYMQIPVLAKYRTGEVFLDKFNLVFSGGPVLDLKVFENLNGGDGAHYWNLAKNKTYADPTRGHNGNHQQMGLFSPVNIGLYLSAGAEYKLLEKLTVYAGFSFNTNFMNMINPALKFDDFSKTPVRTDVRFSSTVVSFDLGVNLPSKK
jgi:opacity protein-like surface antigen